MNLELKNVRMESDPLDVAEAHRLIDEWLSAKERIAQFLVEIVRAHARVRDQRTGADISSLYPQPFWRVDILGPPKKAGELGMDEYGTGQSDSSDGGSGQLEDRVRAGSQRLREKERVMKLTAFQAQVLAAVAKEQNPHRQHTRSRGKHVSRTLNLLRAKGAFEDGYPLVVNAAGLKALDAKFGGRWFWR